MIHQTEEDAVTATSHGVPSLQKDKYITPDTSSGMLYPLYHVLSHKGFRQEVRMDSAG